MLFSTQVILNADSYWELPLLTYASEWAKLNLPSKNLLYRFKWWPTVAVVAQFLKVKCSIYVAFKVRVLVYSKAGVLKTMVRVDLATGTQK